MRTTLTLDKEFQVRAATWKPDGQVLEATYRLEKGAFMAVAKEEGKDPQRQRLELPEEWELSSPYTAFEFASRAAKPMRVGGATRYTALGFGFPTWRMGFIDASTQRHEDRSVKLRSGKEVTARYYTTEMTLPMGKFNAESWTDESGLVLKHVMKMPFGTVTVELE